MPDRSPTPPFATDSGERATGRAPQRSLAAEQTRTSLIGEILWDCHQFSAVTNRAIALIGDEMFVSNSELFALVEVYLRRHVRPRELVERLDLTRGGVTNLLDRLEEAGVIERSPTLDDDLRGVDVTLAPAGRAAAERIANAFSFAVDASEPLLTAIAANIRLAGFDCGDQRTLLRQKPRAAMKTIRRVAAATPAVWAGYRVGFGDEPRPGRTFEVLWVVDRDGGARPTDIAQRIDLKPSSTTQLLDRHEAAGWIARRRSDEDGRVFVVEILPAGRACLEHAIKGAESPIRDFVAELFRA